MHLTAGYAALTAGDFRIDPSHPPLARVWAAIPLAFSERSLDTRIVDQTSPDAWLTRGYSFARDFVSTDIDRALLPARAMTVAWGAILGLLVFAWAYQWRGARVALLALVIFMLEPNVAAHAGLVTTDAALTALVFGTVFFLWRYSQRPGPGDLAALAACIALAAVTKFSAILLGPIVGGLLVLVVARRQMHLRRAALVVAVLAAATMVVVWAAYGFRYAPSDNPQWLFTREPGGGTAGMTWLAAAFTGLDAYRLLPNAFAQGLVYSLTSAGELPSFLAGEVRTGGWWHYFAVALALKTPLAILALGAIGIAFLARRQPGSAGLTPAFIAAPIVVWLAAATMSGVNLGVRHVLPVYPFIVLLAAAGANELLARRRARAVAVALLVVGAIEVGRSEPYPLSFFNALAGGPANGYRYLADSNLGWGGTLKALQRWMDTQGVATINLAYFGSIDPALYGVRANYLPTSASFLTERFTRPQLPGYVAISGTALDGVYLPEWWRRFYSGLRDREPVAVVANTMRIYWVDEWPAHSMPVTDVESVQTLADALLFGLGWPEYAALHYREYLQRVPRDSDAWNGMALALAQTGRPKEAIEAFRRVLTLSPTDPDARRNIALLEGQTRQTAAVSLR